MSPSATVPGYRLPGVGFLQPRHDPAQFTEPKYNRPAVSRFPTGSGDGRPRLFLVPCPHVNNNPIKYNDPSGHCIWDGCILEVAAVLVVATVVLTGDTPKATPPPSDANASNFGDLFQLGIVHATSAKIVGEGLQDLQNDPSVRGA